MAEQQQDRPDEELVLINEQVKIGINNYRIALEKSQPDTIYRLCLEILQQYSFFSAFTVTADVPEIYMQKFWHTVTNNLEAKTYFFTLDDQRILDLTDPDLHCYKFFRFQEERALTLSQIYKAHHQTYLSQHNNLSKRPQSFHHVIKLDIVLGNLNFTNKGAKDPIYKMSIPMEMMSDEIKDFANYLDYLAKSKGEKPIKGRGKGLLTKKGIEVAMKKIETIHVPKKKYTEIVIEETGHLEEVVETIDSEEPEDEDEILLIRRRQTGVVISRRKERKASKDGFILQQRPKSPGEGSGMAPQVLGGPNGSSSSSSSEFKDNEGFLPIDNEARQEISNDENKQADFEKAEKEDTGKEKPVDDQVRNVRAKNSLTSRRYYQQLLQPKKAAKKSMPKYSTKPFDDDSLKGYDLKHKPMSIVSKSKSFNTHPTHQTLYDALMDSLLIDEDDMDNQFVDPPSLKKRCHDDQYPSTDANKDIKKRRKDFDASSSNKSIDKEASSKEANDEELALDDAMDIKGVTHDDAAPKKDRSKWFKQDPVTFDDLVGSVVDFTKFEKSYLNSDKIIKVDLEGPAFNLLKGNYKNYIELKYNMEQCYLALTDQIDWVNPEGDKCPYNLSKPLPLHGPLGYTTILVDFFFNKDLEYQKTGNKEKKYEIVLRRDDQEYVFKEADFPKLYLNEIEDMYLLYAQNKLHHLKGDEQTDLFSDGTLKPVRDILNLRLPNFELGYNNRDMPKRAWTEKDQKRTTYMLEKIDQTLLKRRIIRSLECFVGGRRNETNYRLLTRTRFG
uniref:Uncharacterized protein n=1 Tax=Tanacetum cinerariifolium TaxID=118510 RepID=A0A6L2N5V3_TANCI|nr:hypothetical protein [Tanacetum cinerariifolium]